MAEKVAETDTLSVLLVDDEKLAREELGFLLDSLEDIEVVGQAANGPEALKQIDALDPDIVFMDVQMPGLTGLEVVRQLVERGGTLPHIIFATAYDQYAVQAFEVNASDYLLKPIEKARLEKSIERARARIEAPVEELGRMEQLLAHLRDQITQPSKVLIRSNSRMLLVDAAEVIYATVKDGAIRVAATHADGESNYKTLDELQSNLSERSFWRAHRSFLVNIDRIKEVVPWFKSTYQLRMGDANQTEIPVSRAQTKRLKELFRL